MPRSRIRQFNSGKREPALAKLLKAEQQLEIGRLGRELAKAKPFLMIIAERARNLS